MRWCSIVGGTGDSVQSGRYLLGQQCCLDLDGAPPGRVQGGAVALLADAAITAAVRNAEADAPPFQPVELKLNFLRPLASDGRRARAHGRLVHGGRRTAVAGAEVSDADGRMIAVASGSAVAGPT